MLRPWLSRLQSMLDRRRLDEEMDEEIRTHLEMATEEYMREGMSPEDARRAARKSFGGVEQVRERQREARGFSWLDGVARDSRLAARTLSRERGFTLTAVLTLAIAIGANTAIVSVVDAVLLRPLPYPDAEEIVTVGLRRPTGDRTQARFSVAGYRFFRDENQSFEELGLYNTAQLALSGSGEPMQASVSRMTNSAFTVLSVSPQLGRFPTDEQDVHGGRRVALLSHELWSARFGSDPGVVGRTIELNDTIREVVGVMPAEFGFPSRRIDVWVPLQLDPSSQDARSLSYSIIGRLRADATPESASADADRLIQRLPEVGHSPLLLTTVLEGQASLLPLKEDLVGGSRDLLLVVLGAVSMVLLIALSNVATLFIVRAEERTQQRAVRSALGASRLRLVQHALSEAVLLALAGGLGGVLLAFTGTRVLVALAPPSIPRLEGVGLSGAVLAYATAVSLVAALTFALVPALATPFTRRPASALLAAGRNATAGRERLRIRSVLLATEVALAVMLLIGSGLMVRSYAKLRSVDPGFDPTNLVTFGLVLPATRYSNAEAFDLYQRLVTSLRMLPNVESAAVTTGLPVTPAQASYRLDIEDFPEGTDPFVVRRVTPGYFETMGIPIVAGRTMLPEDADDFRVFVTASFAELYWPGASALGKRIGAGGIWHEVVGVAADDQIRGLDIPMEEAAYVPIGVAFSSSVQPVSVVVRTRGGGTNVAPLLRRVVGTLDPELPLIEISSMDEVISGSYAVSRTSFAMLLLVLAAAVALVLGAVGIYGVVAYVVSRRTSEIGVRIALGASSADVWSRVVGTGVLPALAGVAGGIVVAIMGSRVLAALLFETSPLEPSTFVAGPAVLLVVATAACVVPARRALRVDPARVLRSE
jgi:predicted permease